MTLRKNHAVVAILNLKRATAFRQVLVELGYDVHVARDGDDAQQEFGHGAPQLLITDVSLPKLDGISLVRNLRREFPTDRTGVIVVSAHEQMRAVARQFVEQLGISSILPLDVDRSALREAAQAAVPQPPPATRRPTAKLPLADSAPANSHPLEATLDQATLEATRRFHVPICIAYLKQGRREQLVAHFTIPDAAVNTIDAPDIAILRQLAAVGEPLVLPDMETHPLGRDFTLAKSGTVRGFAAVPLAFEHGNTFGLLCLMDSRPLMLDAADLDNLAVLTRELAGQIDRHLDVALPRHTDRNEPTVEEFQALEILAVTDPLTGLANRRGGEQNIANEISRAKRQKSSLSCILLDIDRFKDINDTYGHQAGDQLLREISALLRRTVRAYDILVRWGGEEFLVVLPGVGLEQTRKLAERVRHAVETMELQGIGAVTVSAGAATLDDDYDFESTLALADRRLYQAKAAGRNCVA